jgi:hypothetical protein
VTENDGGRSLWVHVGGLHKIDTLNDLRIGAANGEVHFAKVQRLKVVADTLCNTVLLQLVKVLLTALLVGVLEQRHMRRQ